MVHVAASFLSLHSSNSNYSVFAPVWFDGLQLDAPYANRTAVLFVPPAKVVPQLLANEHDADIIKVQF